MSLRDLPAPSALVRPLAYRPDAPTDAVDRWTPRAAQSDDPNTISILDVIGSDWWSGDGWTAKRMAGVLRSIGSKPVTVAINSPGGDVFEGLAIYNLLREHPAEVKVTVMGLAASAASVIAMAGDTVTMGLGAEMMVHRSWGMVVGNEDDFAAAVPVFQGFDRSMRSIYAARTGLSDEEIAAYLAGPTKGSDGTWFTAQEAVDAGFADSVDATMRLSSSSGSTALSARHRLDAALAKGERLPRAERRHLFREAGMRDAAGPGTPDAAVSPELAADIRSFIASLKS